MNLTSITEYFKCPLQHVQDHGNMFTNTLAINDNKNFNESLCQQVVKLSGMITDNKYFNESRRQQVVQLSGTNNDNEY